MATQVLLKPQTAASTAATSQIFDSSQCDMFAVMADNLAGAETVQIFVLAGYTGAGTQTQSAGFGNSGGTPVVVTFADGTTPAVLTAACPVLPLEGGPRYVFAKSATAGLCGVYISPKDHT